MKDRDAMRDRTGAGDAPRWLELLAGAHAEPEPGTLARVRARLAARRAEPAWVRWLARPAALAASAALLVVTAWAANVWLSSSATQPSDDGSIVAALLGEDGSYGLRIDAGGASGSTGPDSGGTER